MKKKDDLNQPLTKGEFLEFKGEFGHAMKKIDQRFEAMDNSINQRVTKEEFVHAMEKIDQRFAMRDEKFDAAMVLIHDRFEDMNDRFNDRFDVMLRYVDRRFDNIESRMATKEEIVTKEDWNQHMTLMDRIMAEIEENRRERLFFGEQHTRTEEAVRNHEQRITVLEKATV